MANLGSLFYSLNIKDMTDADLNRIQQKLQSKLGKGVQVKPILKALTKSQLPKGIKIDITPTVKSEALRNAVAGKVMKVAVSPVLTGFREAIARAMRSNPPLVEVGIMGQKLRLLIEQVLRKHGFMINISTVNDNYTKVIQQQLNGRRYKVVIHADAREISRSVQESLMRVQSRTFGLRINREILYRSIDEALTGKRFYINIGIQHGQARQAVQDALMRAQVIGKDQALAYSRLQKGEMDAARAELNRLRISQMQAASAAKLHASSSISLGSAMGGNIRIAGELGAAMGAMYSVQAARQFLANIIEIGGELEHQRIAMDTIFGDKGHTEVLFSQIKALARNSPFGVLDISKSVKALSAYGTKYDEVFETAKRLSDISAATAVDINRLILAFGKTQSRGFLDGLEAKQFAYANIPIYKLVREKLEELEGQAISTADVMKRMKKREIGFDIVKEVLWDQTDMGGKFYNMQEALSESVKTSWKLVRDNIELMYGDMANSWIGGGLKGVAESLQTLTRHWRELGYIILSTGSAFLLAKAYTLGLNKAVQGDTMATYNNIMAKKQKEAADLRAWGAINKLTAAEMQQIATSNKLTISDIQQAIAEDRLTDRHIYQLFALGKLNKAQVLQLRNMGLISAETQMAIANTNRLTISLKMLGASMVRGLKSIGSMLFSWSTAIMTVVAGAVWVLSKQSEETRKAEEVADKVQTMLKDAAKNINEKVEGFNLAEELDTTQLKNGIEELEQIIKEYSPQPFIDINNALINQQGEVNTLIERYNILLGRVKELNEAMGIADYYNIGEWFESGIKASDGFWNESILTNLEDYTSEWEDFEDAINSTFENRTTKQLTEAFEAAKLANQQFAKDVADITDAQKGLETLWVGFAKGKYSIDAVRKSLYELNTIKGETIVEDEFDQLKSDLKDVEDDASKVVERIKTIMRTNWGTDEFTKLTKAQQDALIVGLNDFVKNIEGASEDVKTQFKAMITEGLGVSVNLITQTDGIQLIKKKFSSDMTNLLGRELAIKVRNGFKLSPSEESAVKTAIYNTYLKIFKSADEATRLALNSAMTTQLKPKNYAPILNSLDAFANATDWIKEIRDHLGAKGLAEINIKLAPYTDIKEFTDDAVKAYNECQKSIKKLKLRFGAEIEFPTGELEELPIYDVYNDTTKAAIEEYNKMVRQQKTLISLKDIGFDVTKEEQDNKNNKSPKDPFAEAISERIKLLKEAKSEYEKLTKTMGAEAALKTLSESSIFKGLEANQFLKAQDIPKTLEEYKKALELIQDELEKKDLKSKKHRELNIEIEKVLIDIKNNEIKNAVSIALDKVNKEIDTQTRNWQFYKQLSEQTGNKDFAASIAFGGTAPSDYVSMLKSQVDEQAKAYEKAQAKVNSIYQNKGYTFESLSVAHDLAYSDSATKKQMEAWANIPEEIRKAWEEASRGIDDYYMTQKEEATAILKEYQSVQEQIDAINNKRNAEIAKLNAKDENGNYINDEQTRINKEKQINAQADWEIFTKQSDYLRFFNDVYGMALSEIERIGDAIQVKLNANLQTGLITLEEYSKEMSKVLKQIDEARGTKSNAMTYLTGGVKGYYNKRIKEEEGKLLNNEEYKNALKAQISAQEALNKAKKEGDEQAIAAAEQQLASANASMKVYTQVRDSLVKNQQSWEETSGIISVVSSITQGLLNSFNSIKDMAEALGADTDSDAWQAVGAALETVNTLTSGVSNFIQSAMKGDIGGMLSGVVETITTPFTIWAKFHDNALQRKIDKEKKLYDQLGAYIDQIEARLEYALGSTFQIRDEQAEADLATLRARSGLDKPTEKVLKALYGDDYVEGYDNKLQDRVDAYKQGGTYGYQRELMNQQLESLQQQMQYEAEKKNSDEETIREYSNQITELEQQIKDFARSTADELYGLNIKGWAEEIGNALVDAFSAGEDAAEAFDKTVGEIMRDVVKKLLITNHIEAMMADLDKFLFGDGKGGVIGEDMYLDELEAAEMGKMIHSYKDKFLELESIYDQLNNATGGLLDEVEDSKGLSAGIQGVTEDTAELLASYINAIRAHTANIEYYEQQSTELLRQMSDKQLAGLSLIASKQLETQTQIAENTLRNAIAAEEIKALLTRNTQGVNKFHFA